MSGHYGDIGPVPVYEPDRYASDLHGRGRWVVLQAPLGSAAVRLFTDDRDRLGYMQVGDQREAIDLAQTLNAALRGAKVAGAKATDVFDHWAAMALPTVGAGPVETGDLELLSPTPPTRP